MTWDTVDGRQPEEPRFIGYGQTHQHGLEDGTVITHSHMKVLGPEIYAHSVAMTVAHPGPDEVRKLEAYFPTVLQLVDSGFETDSAIKAVTNGDFSLLKRAGNIDPPTRRERLAGRRVWTSSTGFRLDAHLTWRAWLDRVKVALFPRF